MAVATEAAIEAADGKKIDTLSVPAGGGGAAVDTVSAVLNSEDTYSEAVSTVVDVFWGDTDSNVYGGKLAQKVLHVSAVILFWIGNRCGYEAGVMKKPRKALGLAY